MKKNLVYIQSGGPTSVINSSLYGAIIEARNHQDKIEHVLGSLHGIEGLIYDNLVVLDEEDNEQIELLKQTSGAILGSTRLKLPDDYHHDLYFKIVENIKKHNIGYILINGGNDSMDTCYRISKLCEELKLDVKVMGVPKTIDNDLAITDHSLGFGSACKYVINTVAQIAIDARGFKKGKVHLIEIMGRSAGWLTASCDILDERYRPDLIYIPERHFEVKEFLKDIKRVYDKKGSVIVALSEGINFPRKVTSSSTDGFGHVQLEGVATELAFDVEDQLHLPYRIIELSVPQRAFVSLISKTDQEEAINAAKKALQCALNGETSKMVVLKRLSNHPYSVDYQVESVHLIANAVKTIPDDFLDNQEHMSKSFKEYLSPLIKGETDVIYDDGIIRFAKFKFIKA